MIHDGHYLDFTMQFNIVFCGKKRSQISETILITIRKNLASLSFKIFAQDQNRICDHFNDKKQIWCFLLFEYVCSSTLGESFPSL